MTTEFTNTKVKALFVSEATGQYNLTVVEESPLAAFGGAGIEHAVTLFSRKNNEVNDASVERTQETLREQLGDDAIIFTDPSQATDDPNHISNWVANNVGKEVGLVTKNDNGFFDLGEGGNRNSQYGDSKYLKTYSPAQGAYDPTKHRVNFFEAISAREQEAINATDPSAYADILVTGSNSQYKALETTGVITDIILTSANAFGADPERYSRADLKEEIVELLTQGKRASDQDKQLAEQIDQLPENYAYVDLLAQLGGSDAENVSGSKQGAINGILENIDRETVRFHIQNPQTGFVYQSTSFKAGSNKSAITSQNSIQFEFLTGDFVLSDFAQFLSTVAGLRNTDYTINAINESLVESGIFDPEKQELNINDMTDLLNALRTLFIGRTATIRATLQSPKGRRTDIDKLGTKIYGISLTKNVDAIDNAIITEPSATAESPSQPVSNPFAKGAITPTEEAAEPVTNPFAKAEEPSQAAETADSGVNAEADVEAPEDDNDTEADNDDTDTDDVDVTKNPFA